MNSWTRVSDLFDTWNVTDPALACVVLSTMAMASMPLSVRDTCTVVGDAAAAADASRVAHAQRARDLSAPIRSGVRTSVSICHPSFPELHDEPTGQRTCRE